MPPYPAERPLGPLTPRPGYSLTIAQTLGGRPVVTLTCTACVWHPVIEPMGLDDADPTNIGAMVLEAVRLWLTHAVDQLHVAGADR